MDIHKQHFLYSHSNYNHRKFRKKYLPHVLLSLIILSVIIWWHITAIDNAKRKAIADIESEQDISISELQYELADDQEKKIQEVENLQEILASLDAERSKLADLEKQSADIEKENDKIKEEIANYEEAILSKQDLLKSLDFPEGQYILVSLTSQKLVAFENYEILKIYDISSGAPGRSTPPGSFSITNKYPHKTYVGVDYYYPNTKWNLRYNGPYLIHTAWWHDDFGNPVSHGCINMKEDEAEWLYKWAKIGTLLKIYK